MGSVISPVSDRQYFSVKTDRSVPVRQAYFKDKSSIYHSLVALVKEKYPFDDALQDKAIQFLKSIEPSSAVSSSDFVESILTLLSSPHSTLVGAALFCLSSIEDFSTLNTTLCNISYSHNEWKRQSSEVAQSGKQLFNALKSESYEDTLERMLMYGMNQHVPPQLPVHSLPPQLLVHSLPPQLSSQTDNCLESRMICETSWNSVSRSGQGTERDPSRAETRRTAYSGVRKPQTVRKPQPA
ncbi:hypothetical protein BLNAU_19132 [Blattamonas nauphoetae]|uniref:Uncharacterized protein n=1 Tax=Blattamonas nauphoetae TaxID=2049346 RepID=A0ABQ9X2B6_9EUKA|nr:hypothetical protein BLNAU_19132 [Blattamonas nauphoetae]